MISGTFASDRWAGKSCARAPGASELLHDSKENGRHPIQHAGRPEVGRCKLRGDLKHHAAAGLGRTTAIVRHAAVLGCAIQIAVPVKHQAAIRLTAVTAASEVVKVGVGPTAAVRRQFVN